MSDTIISQQSWCNKVCLWIDSVVTNVLCIDWDPVPSYDSDTLILTQLYIRPITEGNPIIYERGTHDHEPRRCADKVLRIY